MKNSLVGAKEVEIFQDGRGQYTVYVDGDSEMLLEGDPLLDKYRKMQIESIAAAFKKMRGVSKVRVDEIGGGGANLTLIVDGDPVDITVNQDGRVMWNDFSHTTPIGKAENPKQLVKGLEKAFKKMDKASKSRVSSGEDKIASELVRIARVLVSEDDPMAKERLPKLFFGP